MGYTEKGDSYVRKKFVSITNITYKGDAEILTSKMIHFIGFYAKGFLDASLNSKGYTDISDIPRLESYLENVDWENIIDPYSPWNQNRGPMSSRPLHFKLDILKYEGEKSPMALLVIECKERSK